MQPSDASIPLAPADPTEIVRRPDAGTLARGAFEAPAWGFYVGGAVVLLAAILYAARLRSGFFAWLNRARRKR